MQPNTELRAWGLATLNDWDPDVVRDNAKNVEPADEAWARVAYVTTAEN